MKDYTTKGQVTVTTAITSLFGLANSPEVNTFSVPVTVGNYTSTNYVHS